MARIRTVKPEMAQDEDLARTSIEAQLLAVRLLNHADDEGYFKANPLLVKANCFPLMDDSLNIHGMLTELSNAGYIRLGEGSDGKIYGHITNFVKHQKVNRPYPSKISELVSFTERSLNDHEPFTSGMEWNGKGMGMEGEGNDSADAPAPPKKQTKGERLPHSTLPDDWLTFATEEGHDSPTTEFNKFHDYWIAQPGQKGVKLDWFATWRNWIRRSIDDHRNRSPRNDSASERAARLAEQREAERSAREGNGPIVATYD